LGLHFAANLSMLYAEVPFLQRFGLAAEAGFDAVEFLFPFREGIEDIVTLVDDLGLAVVLFDVDPGDMPAGEFGTLSLPPRREHFRRSLEEALEGAQRLGCDRLNTLAGNRQYELPMEAQLDCAVENLMWAAPMAAEAQMTILVEPLNPTDRPDYLVHTTNTALRIIEQVGSVDVKLQYDVYHAQMTEGNLIHTIRRYFDRIGHIQIADVPGRHEPGTGEIHYPAIFSCLQDLDYQGYVGLEYYPSSSTDLSLDWLPLQSRS